MIEPAKIGALLSDDVRWRWVLVAGAVVGLLPWLLLQPVVYNFVFASAILGPEMSREQLNERAGQFGLLMAFWGLPVIHGLLAVFAATWAARRAGIAPVAHGALVALVSVVVGQTVALYYGPLSVDEIVKYLALALAGGLLGGIEARAALAYQEALYEASRRIGEARGPRAVANAIGDNPVSPTASGVALWWSGSPAEGESSRGPEAWAPWFPRGWPEGLRLDGVDAWTGSGSSRRLLPREMPASERAVWREKGIRSVLVVPLVAPGDRRIGLLAVASSERRFARSTVRSYQTIGAQAALALENLRLVEEARKAGRQAGVLRERQRMAHEIHDTLAQGFTSIVMNLQAAEGIGDPDGTRHHMEQAKSTAKESLTEARRLVWALRPEALENASLPEALEGLTERWSRESGISASVATTGMPSPLPAEVEATLFRVAQEALNNARKHAEGASRVALTLSYMGDTVALDARDDGTGFDPAQVAARKRDKTSGGFGLKGMRERVEQVGGTLSVESAVGEGTTLAVELPMAGSSTQALEQRDVEEVS